MSNTQRNGGFEAVGYIIPDIFINKERKLGKKVQIFSALMRNNQVSYRIKKQTKKARTFFLFLLLNLMLIKTFSFLKNLRPIESYAPIHFLKDSFTTSHISNNRLLNLQSITQESCSMIGGSKISYSFSSFTNSTSLKEDNDQKCQIFTPSMVEASQSLIQKILQVNQIRKQRIEKFIQQKVVKELQKYIKQLRSNSLTEEQKINLIVQQKLKIQNQISQNQEFIRLIQMNENHRAMIMIRLATLWNEKYEQMSINELLYLINELQECKELRNNELKSMGVIFLTVETLKKCLLSPRVNKNMICQTKSWWQNATHVKHCLKGEVQARANLQKVESLLSHLLNSIENNSNRYCFMKVQQQLQFLSGEIFKSFHQPDLYNDKSVCLLSNPPRVVFDEPFHQEYDRFIEMAVLVLFDKKLKKQGKMSKLDNITHIFEQVKMYEEGKLKVSYEKEKTSVLQIKKLKKKVNRMDKRVNIIQWIHNFVSNNTSK